MPMFKYTYDLDEINAEPQLIVYGSTDGELEQDEHLFYYQNGDKTKEIVAIGHFEGVTPFTGTNSLDKGIHIRNHNGALVLEEINDYEESVSIISLQAGSGKKFYLKNEINNEEIMSLDNNDILRFITQNRVELGGGDKASELSIIGPNNMVNSSVYSIYEDSYRNNGIEQAYDSGGNCLYTYNWTGGFRNSEPIRKICRTRNSVRFLNLDIKKRSGNPAKPPEGETAIWMSDGTGLGNNGDIIIASTIGGITKYKILFDYSSGSYW